MKKISCLINTLILSIIFFIPAANVFGADEIPYTRYDPWVFTVTHETKITNSSDQEIKNIKVTVAMMNDDQPDYQELIGEELNPWPDKIIDQGSDSRQAVFVIPSIQPGKTIVLEQKYAIENYSITYQAAAGNTSADYDGYQGIDARYLAPEAKIESDNKLIISYAKDVVKNETNPYNMAQRLFADINLFMTYQNGPNANQGALNALRTGQGVCEDYTDLYVASARAVGIPARWMTGYLYLTKEYNDLPYINDDGSLNLSLMRHTWPEVYLPGNGWVVMDPTFTYLVKLGERMEKVVDWNKFGKIESQSRHIFLNYGVTPGSQIQYSGGKPEIEYQEHLEFGNNVFPFRDAVSHWAKDSIEFLNGTTPKILGGYGNGLFGPNDYVTRAQICAMLNRALSLGNNVDKPQFADVSADYWAYADIAAVKGAGLIGGYPDQSFKPDQKINRAEMAAILNRAFDLPYSAARSSFQDLGQPGYSWADADIISLARKGIVAGYAGDLYKPEKLVTRGEVAVFLSRILDGTFRLQVK